MMTPDETGRVWHRGTKLGVYYAIAMAVALLVFGVVPQEVPALSWLEKFQFIILLAPVAAASKAYMLGRRDSNATQAGA